MHIGDIMRLVRRTRPVTAAQYPERAGLSGEHALAFDLTHGIRHLLTDIGSMEAMLGRFDHGETGVLNERELRTAAVRLLGESAGICERLGLSRAEIEDRLRLAYAAL